MKMLYTRVVTKENLEYSEEINQYNSKERTL